MIEPVPKLKIERPLYDHQQLRADYDYEKQKSDNFQSCLTSCVSCHPWEIIKQTVPVVEWIPKYKWKQDFTCDLISGITVAIMHIAQGMAYGMLANVSPVVGIYTAFFPVLVYFVFGNSKHISLGTFAIVCLMTGKVVTEHSDPNFFRSIGISESPIYTPIQVATAVTLTVSIVQLGMYVLRLGIVSTLLSETLVSGFTTGSAIHVTVSQFKDVLGLKIPKERGYFVNVLTMRNIFQNISDVNLTTLAISGITMAVMVVNNEAIKPKAAKVCSFPIPIELMAIIAGTLFSQFLDLNGSYGVRIVGHIPSGLPEPALPPLSLISSIWMESVMIAIVSYTISLSLGLMFAQKMNYDVNANQELLAQGASNLLGSFFSCLPGTASLSRSMIQHSVGGKTQLVSIVSCTILFVILMWIGPLFEPLPRCVLASVILVSLKGMLFQIKEFFKFWSLSKLDAAVWLVTFLTVVFVGIDIGLLVGVFMSLVCILVLSLKPYTCILGWVPSTDLYLDVNRYKGVKELFGIKIFHYQGSINFASKNYFKSKLYDAVGIHPQLELSLRKKLAKLEYKAETYKNEPLEIIKRKQEKIRNRTSLDIRCLILDFSALGYIDPSGVTMLKLLSQEYQRIDIPIYIAGCSEPIYETMTKCDLLDTKKNYYKIFPTVHDAVQYATSLFSVETLCTISNNV